MRIIKPYTNGPVSSGNDAIPGQSARVISNPLAQRGIEFPKPRWYQEWLANKGQWVELDCGCIVDLHLPSAISILTNRPEILCDNHNDFYYIKRSVKFSDVILVRYGVDITPKNRHTEIPPY